MTIMVWNLTLQKNLKKVFPNSELSRNSERSQNF